MSSRDPFPSLKFENDLTLSGLRPKQRRTYEKPIHIAQTEEPWSRLHDTATLASTRRSDMFDDSQGQIDSLDFQLKSMYDHHKDLFLKKNQLMYQRETFADDQKKQEKLIQDMLKKDQEKTIRMWVDPQRCSIYSIK
ncbi:protein C1orf194 homolog [Notolabrus celidotus]|uniref:protein C1orf194 homolog n=1 Tax=Notolabrus celidotus TaxID=1203425 RepID=UPI00148F646E|nr:protein C1orf194 homolog [Notolabrus celidotus]